MSDIRIIKKYPNRRLYDTAISCYITLDEIRDLILQNVEFKVIDAKTEADLTHATLMQIIIERESNENPMLSNQILQDMIRQYGQSMQGAMGQFLEQSMSVFLEQGEQLKAQMQTLMTPANPFQLMNEFAKQNMALWQKMQQQITPVAPSSEETDKPESKKK